MRNLFILGFAVAAGLSAADFDWRLPAGFPRPSVPADNPMSAAKVELGRYLFYDTRISVNGKQSCGSCHRQELAFTDGRAQAVGATGQIHPRSSMSLVNVAYNRALTWARPSLSSLEEQALIPMLGEDPVELGLKDREPQFLAAVGRDAIYQPLFAQAFTGDADPYTLENVARAIAAFERSIASMRSPYDRYRWRGELSAISESAKRGELFFSSSEHGGCFQCHGGWNLDGQGRMRGDFRAPTLRNIAVTAPYMHDGSLATLDDVIDHYAAGAGARALKPFRITDAEKRDLMEFLKSLTDEELLRDPRWSNPWVH